MPKMGRSKPFAACPAPSILHGQSTDSNVPSRGLALIMTQGRRRREMLTIQGAVHRIVSLRETDPKPNGNII
jgi:hypothetical protein